MIDQEAAKRFLDQRKKEQGESRPGGDIVWYSLPHEAGPIYAKIRHLPPWEGYNLPGMIIYKHWNIPEIQNHTCFKTWDMDCDYCNALKKFEGLIDLSEWISKGKAYSNALVMEDTSNNSLVNALIPKVIGMNEYSYYWLLEQVINPDVGDITDPVKGHDVIYKRKIKDGAFERTIVLKERPIGDCPEQIAEILSKMKAINKIWRKPDDEYYKKTIKAAETITKLIETRLLALKVQDAQKKGTESVIPGPQGQPGIQGYSSGPTGNPPETLTLAPPVPTQLKPKGAPSCFSDNTVFDEKKKTCIICAHEFLCNEEIKKKIVNK